MPVLFAYLALTNNSYKPPMEQEFTANVNNQIDIPVVINNPRKHTSKAVVIMIPGTGGFTRNMKFGNSGTDRDNIFKNISVSLTQNGFSTARFDERGYSCNQSPTASERCRNVNDISKISSNTQQDDTRKVYDLVKGKYTINDCIILMTFSEGIIPVSKLLEKRLISPKGIVAVSAPMDSPTNLMQWQMVGRHMSRLSIVSSSLKEAQRNKKSYDVNNSTDSDNLTLSDLSNKKSLNLLTAAYKSVMNDAISRADSEPFIWNGEVMASYGWWKTWFIDKVPISSRLRYYKGPLTLIYGSIDSQLSVQQQIASGSNLTGTINREIKVLNGVGHTLGVDSLLGPMSDGGSDAILRSIQSQAARC